MSILQMEERLWEYIDGISNDEEKASIDMLIHSSPEWKAKYNELLELNRILSFSELEEPSMRFTQNVMEEIVRNHIAPATKTYINKKVIYGLGGFFITMIAGLLIYFFATINSSQGSAATGFAEDISRIRWSEVLNNTYINIFLMVNVVLGLMLLDKYLTSRKRDIQHKKA
jgi:hypothetical protein